MKKIYWMIVAILLILVSYWFIFGISKEQNSSDEPQFFLQDEQEDIDSFERFKIVLRQDTIYSEKELVQQDDWEYEIHSHEVTKQRGDWINPDFIEQFADEEGNMKNGHSFLCVDATIICTGSSSELEFWVNNLRFLILDENGETVGGGELAAATGFESEDVDAYRYSMKEGDSITTKLVYIIEDDWIADNNYTFVEINNHGIGFGYLEPEEYSFILLK